MSEEQEATEWVGSPLSQLRFVTLLRFSKASEIFLQLTAISSQFRVEPELRDLRSGFELMSYPSQRKRTDETRDLVYNYKNNGGRGRR